MMWQIYEDVAQELLLNEPWNWESEAQGAQPKIVPRGVLESAELKHLFSTTYQIKRVTVQQAGQKMDSLQIKSLGEGWKRAK